MKKRKGFSHLDTHKRDRIEALLRAGHSQADMARVLKVNKSTISREIGKRRRKDGRYDAETAAEKAAVKRSNSKYQGMKIENNPELRKKIISMLTDHRSPDEIAGRLRIELKVSLGKNSIYKWVYSPYGQRYCRYLCTKRYRRRTQKKGVKREMIPQRVHISKRPRTRGLVHAEGDTAVSPKRSGSKTAATFVSETSSKLLLGDIVPNLKPASVSSSIKGIISDLKIDTLTFDNGIENKNHQEIGLPTFFCDPHAPWQKPHVETNIGLLRRWFVPKGTDWKKVSKSELQTYLHALNSKYRKSLGYKSAYEVAYEKGILRSLPEGVAFEGGI